MEQSGRREIVKYLGLLALILVLLGVGGFFLTSVLHTYFI